VAGSAAAGPRVSEPAQLRAMSERAGVVVDRLDDVVVSFEYADEDELLQPLFASAVARTVARRTDPGNLRTAVLHRLEPYRTAAGGVPAGEPLPGARRPHGRN
jgi:hypothetical protein